MANYLAYAKILATQTRGTRRHHVTSSFGQSPARAVFVPQPPQAAAIVGVLARTVDMVTFLLWCLLWVLCWPLALAALVLYPLVWLVLLPFRIVGIAVEGVLELVWAVITLPARLFGFRRPHPGR